MYSDAGLYLHVPFCAHKCEYCAFYSAPPASGQMQRFVDALVREIEIIAPQCKPATIFFGGGTPSLLSLSQWEQVLSTIHRLGLGGVPEWTVEVNPATLSAEKARLLREGGVNRISMGVQSLDESMLERLGRVHTRDMVFRSYDILRASGFDNVNIDLMFAIPGQTMAHWMATLDEALALGTEHLSCYEVIYEEDTPLFAQLQAGEFDVDEDLACDMYERWIERAGAEGFRQYEVANLARDIRASETGMELGGETPGEIPRFACRHNVNYWRGGNSFGLGPSATEMLGGVRTRNWSNTEMYIDQLLTRGRRAKEFGEALAPLGRAGELAAFGLRMNAGWPFDLFRERSGFELREEWAAEMAELVKCGWGVVEADRFRLTPQGLRFADAAAERFLRLEQSPRIPLQVAGVGTV